MKDGVLDEGLAGSDDAPCREVSCRLESSWVEEVTRGLVVVGEEENLDKEETELVAGTVRLRDGEDIVVLTSLL